MKEEKFKIYDQIELQNNEVQFFFYMIPGN